MKPKLSNLKKKTPRKLRRLGNALFLAAQGAAALSLATDIAWLTITLVVVGFLGKFLTELFGEDHSTSPNP